MIAKAIAETSDTELISRVGAGDHQAFASLVERYYGRCFGLSWRILNDRAEAEDAVQDAFMKIWTGAATSFDPARGRFVGWLNRIVTNTSLDRRRLIKSVDSMDHAEQVPDEKPGADRLAESQQLYSLMADMPARQRAALTLFYIEGYTMQEVAKTMETNDTAVESLLSRGRLALRTLLSTPAHNQLT